MGSSAQAEWSGIDPGDESELPNLDSEANIGGIYIRLLVANPGWILRKPKETLGDLLEADRIIHLRPTAQPTRAAGTHSGAGSAASNAASTQPMQQPVSSLRTAEPPKSHFQQLHLRHAHLTPSGRALVVSILKAMSSSRVHGQRVALLLDKCPSWASYRDQRHDLFLQASGSALPALPAGVAGYITHHRTPNLPKQLSPPTDPLQSMPD